MCVCVTFCFKLGKHFTETFQLNDAIVAVNGERIFSTKKSTDVSVEDQGVVGCVFLIGKALSIMDLYHVVR